MLTDSDETLERAITYNGLARGFLVLRVDTVYVAMPDVDKDIHATALGLIMLKAASMWPDRLILKPRTVFIDGSAAYARIPRLEVMHDTV